MDHLDKNAGETANETKQSTMKRGGTSIEGAMI